MRLHPTSLILLPLALAACGGVNSRRDPEPDGGDVATAADTTGAAVPMTAPSVSTDASGNYAPEPQPEPRSGEQYNPVRENGFVDADREPLSTFAIDVDAASYANVRRYLAGGQLPPVDAVRVEELVNYFDYDYPNPRGATPFTVVTEVSAAPWNREHRLVHVGIQGRRMEASALPPSNLVFLVDVSGSMDEPNKLPLLKQALAMMTINLRPQDRVSIVTYAGEAGVALQPTSGRDQPRIERAIEQLAAGGSTNGGDGIQTAYRLARDAFIRGGNNRVILATDGDFNVGVSSEDELVRLIESERESGIFLTVLGLGTGNLQDGKMEQLADHGNGNYTYVDGIDEARKALVEEASGTLFTIAKDVKVQVEFNPAVVRSYRLIGYENRTMAAHEFRDDRKDAGELGAGHSVTALYEVVPRPSPRGDLLTVRLRYKEPQGDVARELTHALADHATPLASTSADFRFAAAVAEWGMLLRRSEFARDATYGQVAELARGAVGGDPNGHRREFLRLIDTSRELAFGRRVDSEDVAVDR